MKNRLTFKEFVNESRADELGLEHQQQSDKLANLMVGRFQPPTLGHLKVLKSLSKKNGYPVIILATRPKKKDPKKYPFESSVIKMMFEEVIKNEKFVAGYREIPTGSIVEVFNQVRPDYEPILWGAGSDRIKGYKRQVDSYKYDLNGHPDLDVFEIKRDEDSISATKVRESLLNGDEKLFQSMMPKYLWSYFETLKSQLS